MEGHEDLHKDALFIPPIGEAVAPEGGVTLLTGRGVAGRHSCFVVLGDPLQ